MKFILIVTVTLCSANCFAICNKRSFEDLLSIWIDKLAWAEEDGFSLSVVNENPPELIYPKGDCGNILSPDKGTLNLKRGSHYVFTNGSGRTQEFKFVDPTVEGSDSKLAQVFPSDVPILLFMHLERFAHNEQWVKSTYLIGAKGVVYDVNDQTLREFTLPFAAKTRESVRSREKRNMIEYAQNNLEAAQKDLEKAKEWLVRNPDETPIESGVTNEVHCGRKKDPNLDVVARALENETLSTEVRAMLAARLKQSDQVDRGESILLCRFGDVIRIVGFSEGLGNGRFRRIAYDANEKVALTIQNIPSCGGYWLRGYANGNLTFRLDFSNGRINCFWIWNGDDYVKSKDVKLSKKLLDDALEFWNLWKNR